VSGKVLIRRAASEGRLSPLLGDVRTSLEPRNWWRPGGPQGRGQRLRLSHLRACLEGARPVPLCLCALQGSQATRWRSEADECCELHSVEARRIGASACCQRDGTCRSKQRKSLLRRSSSPRDGYVETAGSGPGTPQRLLVYAVWMLLESALDAHSPCVVNRRHGRMPTLLC
jgi:hypothetical protein